MAPEAIISLVPFGSMLIAIVVTGAFVWFATALITNLRWKRVFWPHADTIAKQKTQEQDRIIAELEERLEVCNKERVAFKKKLEAVENIAAIRPK